MKQTNKKGYVFALDITLAAIILIVGLALLFYFFGDPEQPYYFTDQISSDVIGVLAETRTTDLCEDIGTGSCNCPNYEKLNELVCEVELIEEDATLLELFSEHIMAGHLKNNGDQVSGEDIQEVIHEMFADKKVIDEKRFGFAVLYTFDGTLLELYNTETYEATP